MIRRPFLLIAVTLIAASACNLDAVRDNSPLSFAIYFVDPPPPPPQIVLLVATETQYPCLGYQLGNALNVSGSALRVSVSDRVTKPEVCATAIGPAGFRRVLPITLGTYSLEFTRDGVTDRYIATATETAIEIATIEAHFTRPTALRFPRGG